MEFLDKVKKVATDVAAASSKQSKKLYSIAKLNLEVVEKQNSVKALYKEVGFEAYKAFQEEKDVKEAILPLLEKIDSIEEKIAIIRKTIDDVKTTEEVGVEDAFTSDSDAFEADVYDGQSEYVEAETEPVDPIE